MSRVIRKLSGCLMCKSGGDDSDSTESEPDNTMMLPHRMPAETSATKTATKPAVNKGVVISGGQRASKHADRPVDSVAIPAGHRPRPKNTGGKGVIDVMDKPRKDRYHRSGGKDESTLIIDPGTNFPKSSNPISAPSAEEDDDNDDVEFEGDILPENIANFQTITLSSTAAAPTAAARPGNKQSSAAVAEENPVATAAADAAAEEDLDSPNQPSGTTPPPPWTDYQDPNEGWIPDPAYDTRRFGLIFPTRQEVNDLYPDRDIVTAEDIGDFLRFMNINGG
ncbi:hypothetical protein TWF281_004873 [Arthrobotrys megalospora]